MVHEIFRVLLSLNQGFLLSKLFTLLRKDRKHFLLRLLLLLLLTRWRLFRYCRFFHNTRCPPFFVILKFLLNCLFFLYPKVVKNERLLVESVLLLNFRQSDWCEGLVLRQLKRISLLRQ